MNEAMWANTEGVATERDIDTAMKMGTNYPHGPLEWVEKLASKKCSAYLQR